MTQRNFDATSVESIFEYSKKLTGKSLREAVGETDIKISRRSRGALGNLVEEFYFGYKPNSAHRPDFPDANLELKVTGVKQNSDNSFSAKERLVLTMINFEEIVKEDWGQSSLLQKCGLMLILFYLYDGDLFDEDRRFVLDPMFYNLREHDAEIIERDWQIIRAKVVDGKAHELSEGDTFYLGACRKGAGGKNEKLRKQPFSDELAKGRAFSFKQTYLNQLIQGHEAGETLFVPGVTLEESTALKFQPFLGKSVEEISQALGYFKRDKNQKGFNRQLASRMLGADPRKVAELVKADIEMKTVRLNSNGVPKESMSFPGFGYLSILEEEWEESSFFEKLERKFLFVVFRVGTDGIERFEKVGYWNMPFADRQDAKGVWEETKRRVAVDARDLPRIVESRVAHVRPKASNRDDTIPTPQGEMLVKKCFWLNRNYIGQVIQNL